MGYNQTKKRIFYFKLTRTPFKCIKMFVSNLNLKLKNTNPHFNTNLEYQSTIIYPILNLFFMQKMNTICNLLLYTYRESIMHCLYEILYSTVQIYNFFHSNKYSSFYCKKNRVKLNPTVGINILSRNQPSTKYKHLSSTRLRPAGGVL